MIGGPGPGHGPGSGTALPAAAPEPGRGPQPRGSGWPPGTDRAGPGRVLDATESPSHGHGDTTDSDSEEAIIVASRPGLVA